MRDIAAGADLSVANLYHHFSGKDEILFFCQDRSLDLMLASVAAARRRRAGAADQLRHVLRAHAATLLDEVEGAVAHVATDALPDPLRRQIVAKRDRYERALRALVSAGMARGEFVRVDVRLITRAMLGAVNWTATWFRADGERSAGAVAEAMAEYLVRGVSRDRSGEIDGAGARRLAATTEEPRP